MSRISPQAVPAISDPPLYATLTLPDGRSHKLPLLTGRGSGASERFLDISALAENAGILCFDPGFTSTASCKSAITYIDGLGGRCLYRGIRVEELARNSNYVETSWLLLHGRLPSKAELCDFDALVKRHSLVHEKVREFFGGFQLGAHPMAIMVAVVGALSAFYPPVEDQTSELLAARVIGKFPTLAAMAYKTAIGEPIVYPRKALSFAGNFLHMMFATPVEAYEPHPVAIKALDAFLILHADHEQNASTATVRIAGSSQANPFACLAAGIASLWGPAHGGANEAVMKMLAEIGSVDKVDEFIAKVKNKETRLMGFGHRVYKNFDPRAVYMRELTREVLDTFACDDEQLRLAMALEERALKDEYFVQRKLYPNVDFYSGIMLRAIGIPISMYTVLFAMARSIGWISHWIEMTDVPTPPKIGRPRQIFTGLDERNYTPLHLR
jgi:citrate synthase